MVSPWSFRSPNGRTCTSPARALPRVLALGLVFVAVSINVERILAFRGLPERGLVTVLLLLGAVVASLFGLHPDQSDETLGWEILIGGCVLSGIVIWLVLKSRPRAGEESHMASALGLAAVGTLPYIVAGILLSGSDAGLDWLFSGIVGAIVAGVVNGWVLLVEIRAARVRRRATEASRGTCIAQRHLRVESTHGKRSHDGRSRPDVRDHRRRDRRDRAAALPAAARWLPPRLRRRD